MWCVKLRGKDGTTIDAREIPDDPLMLDTGGLWTPEWDEVWGFGDTEGVARVQAEEYRTDIAKAQSENGEI